MKLGAINQFRQNLPMSEGPVDETGFVENMRAGFRVAVDEDLSISRFFQQGAYNERNESIDQMLASGEIPRSRAEQYSEMFGYNYGAMAYDLKADGYEIMDDHDVRDGIRASLREQREKAEDIHRRADWAGVAGTLTGQMGGLMLDPVNIGAVFVPGLGMARTAALSARIGKTALYYGATGAAAEAVIQPLVYDWKQEIKSEYTMGDAMTNIALGAVGEATLGTALELGIPAIKDGLRNIRKNVEAVETPEVAAEIIQELDEFEVEYDRTVKVKDIEEVDNEIADVYAQLDEIGEIPEAANDIFAEYRSTEFHKWVDDMDVEDLHAGGADMIDDVIEEIELKALGFTKYDRAFEADYHPTRLVMQDEAVQAKEALAAGYDPAVEYFRGAPHEKGLKGYSHVYFSASPDYTMRYSQGTEATSTLVLDPEAAPVTGKYYMPKDAHIIEAAEIEQEFMVYLTNRYGDNAGESGLKVDEIEAILSHDSVEGMPWQVANELTDFLDKEYPNWQAVKIFEGDARTKLGQHSYLAKRGVAKSAFHDFSGKHIGPQVPGEVLSARNRAAAEAMDAASKAEEAKLLGDADEVKSEMLAQVDDDEFMEMSQAERDAMLDDLLGEDMDRGSISVEMESGVLDADGNMTYVSKSAEDVYADIAEQEDMLQNFITCWSGNGD